MHSERKSAIQCSQRLCGIDTADTYAMPDLAGLLVSCIQPFLTTLTCLRCRSC